MSQTGTVLVDPNAQQNQAWDNHPPYDEADKVHAKDLKFDHEDKNGDRFYSCAAQVDEKSPDYGTQAYFYRAMKRDEAFQWLTEIKSVVLDPNGHHGFASHRKYSKGYLTKSKGYSYLLEVHAPDFITKAKEIGFKSGKAEAGDMSWGVGGTNSNSWGADKKQNKTIEKRYKEFWDKFPNQQGKDFSLAGGKVPGNKLRAAAVEMLPYIFKECIKSIKIVNLRSEKK